MAPVMTARVAVAAATYAIDKPYTYLLPDALAERARPGMRVLVPFGRGSRRAEGLLLSCGQEEPRAPLKPLLALLDEEPVLDRQAIKLALWMRERYFCTVHEAVKTMLPAGLYFSLKDSYSLCPGVEREAALGAAERSETARRVLELIFAWNGSGEVGQLRAALGERDPGPALRMLCEKGVLRLETSAARGVGDKSEQVASLALPAEEAMARVIPARGRAPLRYSVVELLCAMGSASAKEICYFTGASMPTLRALARSGVIALEKREAFRRPAVPLVARAGPPELNGEQSAACAGLCALADRGEAACALLYGVTGSGKTQVYIQLIRHVLEQGKTAMVLVPEIALTPQLLRIFTAQFGDAIAILHSSLRTGERYDEWKRVRSGAARVVIGTRSAVFAPLENMGVLILDEEQEPSYKSENAPRYHARDIAKYRCAQGNALLVLGSATPAVESMYYARTGVYHLFTMTQRYNEGALPQVMVADLRAELRAGSGGTISAPLRRELAENLARGEQSILFLNRRGSRRMAICTQCGLVPECPRCSVHLTYHRVNGRLMCHHCGHSQPLPDCCPECGGALSLEGAGTQLVEEELGRLFPWAEVLRMDTDTVSASQPHEKLLSRFEKRRIPILVGTQMVAKGLDFENVTLVGVIDADSMLYVDNFRAAERTFSLLTQVVGRAGRGGRPGRAVIQTYTPDNDVIALAVRQDYDGFYEHELALRAARGLPPLRDMYVMTFSGPDEGAVLRACMRMRDSLLLWRAAPAPVEVLGPAAAPVLKVNDRYRYRLTIFGQGSAALRGMLAQLLRAAHEDRLNRGVSVFVDWNPLE